MYDKHAYLVDVYTDLDNGTHTITALSITVESISSLAATCVRTYSVLTVLFTLLLTIGTFIDVYNYKFLEYIVS